MTDKEKLRLVRNADQESLTRLRSDPGTNHRSRSSILPLTLKDVGYSPNGKCLLSGVNLNIEQDRPTIILGPNGAGKTLLLRICHGLLEPSQGSVEWHNPKIAKSPSAQAMVFQRPILLRRSVKRNIEYAMKVCGIDPRSRPHQLEEALAVSGLEKLADRRAALLSGGEQQRLALARCAAINPQVLFLDEPTSHLDPSATRQIESMIRAMRASGVQIVMVTHDLGQAARLADQVVFMHAGKLIECTSASKFFNAPQSAEASAFLGGDLLW